MLLQPPPIVDLMRYRAAVAPMLGQVLTPEAAAAIEAAALAPAPDNALNIARFAPAQHGAYTVAVERFRDVVHELHALHVAHWQETEAHRHGLKLAPDYCAMSASERDGQLLQFTVRHAGALVGNLRMYLLPSRHTRTLVAKEDTLYLLPEHRGGWLSVRLLRYAERVLIACGAREIQADSKLVNNADVLMRRLGYQEVAIQFVKIIKEHDHVQ